MRYITTYFDVIDKFGISDIEYKILYYLYFTSGFSKSGWAIVSDKKMAKELRVSESIVRQRMPELLKAGYIIHGDNHINGTVRSRKVSDVFADAINAAKASIESESQVKPPVDDKKPKDPPVIPTKNVDTEHTDKKQLLKFPRAKFN